MNSLYSLGVRQTSSLNADLDAMALSGGETSASTQGQIAASLAALSRTIEDYDSLARKEMISAKQEKALARVVRFRDDFKRIRDRFASLKKEKAAEVRSYYRSGNSMDSPSAPRIRRQHSNSSLNGSSTFGGATSSSLIPPQSPTHESPFSFRPNNPRPHQQPHYQAPDRMSHAHREDTFASQAESQLDGLIAQGREVLGSLVEQRGWLKGTKKRLLDAANGVKGGREVVGWVERRSKQDTVIFFIGATITLGSFGLIWWYLG
ncbi:hypothetical protein BDY24DRAFT_335117 [Mrakia frigida]|uniref:Bos1p n=1 Tax=Mrakia frigida TaxID=29902 RepID=UPI003FCBF15B